VYLSVDIGGTNIRIAGSDSLFTLNLVSDPVRGLNSQYFEKDIHLIVEAARTLAGKTAIEAVGICIPGSLNEDKSELKSGRYMSAWVGRPLVRRLEQELGCQVILENDGVAAGLGEAFYGGTPDQFWYVIWGTGIGGSVVERSEDGLHAIVRKLDHKTHFRAWEDACGGRELELKYGRHLGDIEAQEWEKIQASCARNLTTFVNRAGAEAVILAGGIAIRHGEGVIAKAGVSGARISRLGENSGLYGGFALIRQSRAIS
jgi:hypothetical protein